MKIYYIATICLLGLTAFAVTSCSDDDTEEVTSLNFSKNFAPLDAKEKTTKQTSATLTWEASANATGYEIEVFEDDSLTFVGEPIQTLSTKETEITIEDLLFDTQYSARIKAITEGNENRTSSWATIAFRTTAKQFLSNPKESDVSDRGVTLTWDNEEGFAPTSLVVGPVSRDITDEERTAKSATITGLEPETIYTAYIYYNGKECGKRTFTTIADLEGAILVHDGDDLKKIIEDEELADNAVIALYAGTYSLNGTYDEETGELQTTGAAKVNKSISIKGIYPTSRPVIKGRFEINDGAALKISQAIIDGSLNSTSDQLFNFKTDKVNYGVLDIQNCTITGRSDGKGLIYLNVESTIESININNCVVTGILCTGGDFIDSRKGLPRNINLTNSTFNTVATARDFIRIDDASSKFEGETGPIVTVDHCTLYKVGCGSLSNNEYTASNNRLLYVRYKNNKLTWTNNLTVGTIYKRGFANGNPGSTAINEWAGPDQNPTLQNNFYYKCENLTSPKESTNVEISWFDTSSTAYDVETETGVRSRGKGNGTVLQKTPFKDETIDLTLDPDGDAAKAGAGDPRWIQ